MHGTKLEPVKIVHYLVALNVINLTIIRLVACFSDLLNEAEVMQTMAENVSAYKHFHEQHFYSVGQR